MAELPLAANRPALRLDLCVGCEFVWFDPREFEQFPPPDAPKPLPEKARELIAKEQLRQDAERAEREAYNQPGPDEWWQWLPAVLGMPVVEKAPPLHNWPWLTYGLAALLVAVYLLTAGNLKPSSRTGD